MSSNALLWPSQGTKPEERLDKYKYLRLPSQGIAGGVISPPSAVIVKTVEKIEITISTGTISNTGTLTKSQIDTKCVPFTTIRTTKNTEERFDTRFVTVTIIGSTVTATRDASSGSTVVEVIVYVVEFTNACTVQTGEATIGSGNLTVTDSPSTDFTDLTKTFVYMTYMPNSAIDDINDAFTTVEITNTTTLTFTRQSVGSTVNCRWYTVECDATQFDVQRGSFLLDGTDNTSQSAAFTAVDLARTMVIGNYNSDLDDDNGETGNCTIDLVDTTHVRARRANGTTPLAGEIDIDFQVIQFETSQNISVQRGEFLITGTSDTDTIIEVDIDGSMAHSPGGQNNASINSIDGDDYGQFFCSMDVQDSTTVRGRVVTDVTLDTVNSWEVVEWIPEPPVVVTMDFEDGTIMEYEDNNTMEYES